jgi:hypothetical protein
MAIGEYHHAYEVLSTRLGVMSKKEYEELKTIAERYREIAEKARDALNGHTTTHGC